MAKVYRTGLGTRLVNIRLFAAEREAGHVDPAA